MYILKIMVCMVEKYKCYLYVECMFLKGGPLLWNWFGWKWTPHVGMVMGHVRFQMNVCVQVSCSKLWMSVYVWVVSRCDLINCSGREWLRGMCKWQWKEMVGNKYYINNGCNSGIILCVIYKFQMLMIK